MALLFVVVLVVAAADDL